MKKLGEIVSPETLQRLEALKGHLPEYRGPAPMPDAGAQARRARRVEGVVALAMRDETRESHRNPKQKALPDLARRRRYQRRATIACWAVILGSCLLWAWAKFRPM